jgi:hypothetical protein
MLPSHRSHSALRVRGDSQNRLAGAVLSVGYTRVTERSPAWTLLSIAAVTNIAHEGWRTIDADKDEKR